MPISFWFITLILNSPKHYEIVLERIQSHLLPNSTSKSEPLFDVPSLVSDPYLQACFQETLRLRGQNGSLRIVNEATTLPVNGKEYYLRQGSLVFIPAPLIHMDTEIYSNVTEFQPERFLDADLESTMIIVDGHASVDEKREAKPPKFFKKGVPVKHYMMPFGGGDSLVSFSMDIRS